MIDWNYCVLFAPINFIKYSHHHQWNCTLWKLHRIPLDHTTMFALPPFLWLQHFFCFWASLIFQTPSINQLSWMMCEYNQQNHWILSHKNVLFKLMWGQEENRMKETAELFRIDWPMQEPAFTVSPKLTKASSKCQWIQTTWQMTQPVRSGPLHSLLEWSFFTLQHPSLLGPNNTTAYHSAEMH